MKKLTLDHEALKVESFATDAPAEEAGTVHGQAQTEWDTCPGRGPTCDSGETCFDSCDPTVCPPPTITCFHDSCFPQFCTNPYC